MSANPYVFAISMGDLVRSGSEHAILGDRLSDAGFDVGTMLWTSHAQDFSRNEIRCRWKDIFKRAGIEKLERREDQDKQRIWYRVWRKQPTDDLGKISKETPAVTRPK